MGEALHQVEGMEVEVSQPNVGNGFGGNLYQL